MQPSEGEPILKIPLSAEEVRLLRDLFDPRRASVAFPRDTAEAARLHEALHRPGEPDLERHDAEALARLLGNYLRTLAGPGEPVPANAPLDATVDLADQAPLLAHVHAQLVRHLKATE